MKKKSVSCSDRISFSRRIRIGYLAPHAYGQMASKVLSGIMDAAAEYNIDLVCIDGGLTEVSLEKKVNTLGSYRFINPGNLDGLLVWALTYYLNNDEAKAFLDGFSPLPKVTIARSLFGIPSVDHNELQHMEQIIDHLVIDHEFQKIALIQAPKNYPGEIRNRAFLRYLNKHHIIPDPKLIASTVQFNKENGIRGVKQLFLERGLRPKHDVEAIVAGSDILASGAIETLFQMGINVPRDIAVIGYNNSPEYNLVFPTLTTIDPDFYAHGYHAVKHIMSLIHGKEIEKRYIIPGKLILRESCGCSGQMATQSKTYSVLGPERSRFAHKSFITTVTENREVVIQGLHDALQGFYNQPDGDLPVNLLEALLRQMQDGTETFYDLVKGYLNQAQQSPLAINRWHEIVSKFRNILLPFINCPGVLLQLEDIWNQSRVIISMAVAHSIDALKVGYTKNTCDISHNIRLFNSAFNLDGLLDAIEKRILELGLSFFGMVLYDEQSVPVRARLVLTIIDGERVELPGEEALFDCSRILPDKIITRLSHNHLYIEPCSFEDYHMGYLLFKLDSTDASFYEAIRISISTALRGIDHIQELVRTREEREKLYCVLEEKNEELELQTVEINQAYERLKLAIDEVNQANQAKSQFLTNMSHEIRTPIHCILGMAEILEGITEPQERSVYQKNIIKESSHLLELVNQLLDISKIEAGKLKLENEPFNLHELLESVAVTFALAIQDKGLDFQVNITERVPYYVSGDALRLRQILVNLIGNALKFTERGGIRIDVDLVSWEQETATLRFEIHDTGVGIPKERQHAIFDLFVQAEENTTRKFGGTGLGTAISKQLVEMMGGTIGLESQVGKGSNFFFTIVLLPSRQEEIPTPIPAKIQADYGALPDVAILLVEDYPTNRQVAVAHLKSLHCRVDIAVNGREAVAKFCAGSYHIVLMDVQMPEMDGYEATKTIRREPRGQRVPIVGMTANAYEQDIAACREAGMDDVIVKPFTRRTFLDKVVFWANERNKGDGVIQIDGAASPRTVREENGKPVPIQIGDVLDDFGGDRDGLLDIIRSFFANVHQQITKIGQALSAGNMTVLSQEAHSIKGSALILKMNNIAGIALQLERMSKDGDISKGEALLSQLSAELERVEKYIDQWLDS